MLNVPALQETTVSGEKMVANHFCLAKVHRMDCFQCVLCKRWLHSPSSGHGGVLLASVSGCVQSDQCTSWGNHRMVHSTPHLSALPWVTGPWGAQACAEGAQWTVHDLDV